MHKDNGRFAAEPKRRRNIPSERVYKRAPTACTAATPYENPQAETEFQAYTNYTITWLSDCLDAKQIDIYLYDASTSATAPLHAWTNVQAGQGDLQTVFQPSWWNGTADSTAELYLQFVDAGDPAWASSYPVGPSFNVKWDGNIPADMTPTTQPTWNTTVEAQASPDPQNSGVTGGKLVAAVLIPLLVVIALGAVYVVWNRRKSKSATKRWSKVVEKRMSQISAAGSEWRPPAPRPGSLAASHISAYHHRSTGSLGSNFFAEMSQDASRNNNRASRISFATAQQSPNTSPPKNRQPIPRIGQNRMHKHQASVSSSLRHEFRGSNVFFSEADLAGAVSYIQNDNERLSSYTTGTGEEDNRSFSQGNHNGMHSTQASIGSHRMLPPHSSPSHPGTTSAGHARMASEMSLKMPKLQRSSLSPDQALLAYAEAKDKQQDLPVQTSQQRQQRQLDVSVTRPLSAYGSAL